MPVPPIESIKTFGRSRIVAFQKQIKNNHFCFDLFMAITIFLATIVELISLYLRGDISYDIDVQKYKYLVHIYPLLMQSVICVFASFFIFKILRYKSCIYTQITTILYAIIQYINLLFIIFKFGLYYYDLIIYPIFLYLILSLIITKTIRWFIYQ